MKLVAITGASRGLGKAAADVFRSNGWDVLEMSRPDFTLEKAGEMATYAFSQYAGINYSKVVLISNAARIHIEPAIDVSAETIASEVSTNIAGPIQLMSAFLRIFPNGEIVDISSGAVNSDIAGWSLYSVAKAAMARYIKALASEGHKARCFVPGVFDTDMQAKIRSSQFEGVDHFKALKAEGKLLTPEAVATRLFEFVVPPPEMTKER